MLLAACAPSVKVPPQPIQTEKILSTSTLIVYYSPRCPHCTKARDWLAVHEVNHEERDVKDPKFKNEFLALGGRGVPLFVLRGRVLQGFTPETLEDFLKKGGYKVSQSLSSNSL